MDIRAVEIFNLHWGHWELAHHDLLKEKTLSAIQYNAKLLKAKKSKGSNNTYKTKLSFKTIYNLI